jgi:hypothetical protein
MSESPHITTLKATRCVGKMRISFGKWYSPVGTEPGKTTYCWYCYSAGCFDNSAVTVDKFNNCNCDCPHREDHPRFVSLLCPLCRVRSMGITTCGSGKCLSCGTTTYSGNRTYCDNCSLSLCACRSCGERVKSGDECVTDIERWVEKEVAQRRVYIAIIDRELADPGMQGEIPPELLRGEAEEHEEAIADVVSVLKTANRLYTGKSCEEVLEIITREY